MKKVIIITAWLVATFFLSISLCHALDIPITIASAKVAEVSTGYKKQIDWPASQRMISNPDYVAEFISNPAYDAEIPEYIDNPAYPGEDEPEMIENPEYIDQLMINPAYDSELHEGIPTMRLETIAERFQSDVKQHLVNMANAGNLKIALEEAKDNFVPLTSLD